MRLSHPRLLFLLRWPWEQKALPSLQRRRAKRAHTLRAPGKKPKHINAGPTGRGGGPTAVLTPSPSNKRPHSGSLALGPPPLPRRARNGPLLPGCGRPRQPAAALRLPAEGRRAEAARRPPFPRPSRGRTAPPPPQPRRGGVAPPPPPWGPAHRRRRSVTRAAGLLLLLLLLLSLPPPACRS